MDEMPTSIKLTLDRRLKVLAVLAAGAFWVLLFRLFYLQVIRGPEMFELAEQNRTQIIPLKAPRGLVMDRTGDILLGNAPRFSVMYSAQSVSLETQRVLLHELVKLFPGAEQGIRRKLNEARQSGKMTKVLSGISRPIAFALIERRLIMPGLSVIVEPQRHARYGALAGHVLGYVDEISSAELDSRRSQGYRMGQLIGKMGVERVYDRYLRGEDGGLQFEMDAGGRHIQVMRRIHSQPGADVVLTLDRHIQEAAEKGLSASPTSRGAVVVLDPRSGAVLALASHPDFDPSVSVSSLLSDPLFPLFNRALQGIYPPGSVFKPVTATAGLKSGWDITRTFYCTGNFRLGTKDFGCWSVHRRQDFMGAMAWSCNNYFYNMGLLVGPDPIEKVAKNLGLGERTGIDLTFEVPGFVPGRDWKEKIQKTPWFNGDTLNFAIGQGALIVTPLQMAVMISAIANGGRVWRPYVVERVIGADEQLLFQQSARLRREIEMGHEVWNALRLALRGVATQGTGRSVNRTDLHVGAKTGTAQNPHGEDHAWFVAFAGLPGEPASLVVVVCVEHGGQGSTAAGPVARRIINTAFPLVRNTSPI